MLLRSRLCFCLFCGVLLALLGLLLALDIAGLPQATAQAPKAAAKPVSFINDIAPIFKESCFGCHGAKNPKGKLDMTKYETLRKGGFKDDPIVEGKHEESYLHEVLVASGKKRMPPIESGDALPKEKIDLIARWIKEGAKLDGGLKKDADLIKELRIRWKSPTPLAVYPYPVTITAMAFSPDGKKLVVGGHHELTIWDVNSGSMDKRIRTRARRATAMQFLPDGKLVVAGGRPGEEGDVHIYDVNAGKPKTEGGVTYIDGVEDPSVMVKQLLECEDEVLCLAVSADGKKIASGGCDRMVNIWDISAGLDKVKAETPVENHADWVFGIAFSPDGKLLFTSSRDKTAKIWDIAAKESQLTYPDHQNTVYGVLVKGDGKAGYSVGEDSQLRMWNTGGDKAGKMVKNVGAHAKAAFKVAQVPKQPLVATCGADSSVKVWNEATLANTKTMTGFTDHVYALAVSPDGTLVAGGAFNGEVRIYKIADGALVKSFNASPGFKVEAKVDPKK